MPSKRCPKCGLENDSEVLSCLRCGASLPAAQEPPPPGAEPEARTVVLRTFTSHAEAQIVSNHLEGANISVVVAADDCGGLLPVLNPILGIHLLVKDSDLARAEEALRELEEEFGIKTDGKARDTGVLVPGQPSPRLAKLGFFALGALVGALVYYAVTSQRGNFTGPANKDLNGDGLFDVWRTYENGEVVKFSADRNFDGKPDMWSSFHQGRIQTSEDDTDYDGKPDVWHQYTYEDVSLSRTDYDFDGRPDAETRYAAALPVEAVFSATNKLGYWRRDFFTNGVMRESHLDRDRDGVLDERILFDAFSTFLRAEPMK